MDVHYEVLNVNLSAGQINLRDPGSGRLLRVKLGRARAAAFEAGMTVKVRQTNDGRLVLEARTDRLASSPAVDEALASRPPAGVADGGRRERRAAPRKEHRGPVAVSVGGKVLRCTTRDIGPRGMALLTAADEQLQGTLRLAFRLPGSKRMLDTSGVVIRTEKSETRTVWGIGFHSPPAEVISALDAFVAAADPEVTGAHMTGPRGVPARARYGPTPMDSELSSLYQDALARVGGEPPRS